MARKNSKAAPAAGRLRRRERREAIVAAAVRLFAERGFRGTTTRELAAALGVTEPVLYQHFAHKSELYTAIIEEKAAEGQERVAELVKSARRKDDRSFFSELAALVLERYDRDPDFIRLLLFGALEGHELASVFYRRRIVAFYELVSGYIRRRTKDGAFREIDPVLAARAFIGMVSDRGMSRVLFHTRGRVGRRRDVEQLVALFLEGIGA